MKLSGDTKQFENDNLENELLLSYSEAKKDEEFVKLVNTLGISDDIAKKYTTKLQKTVEQLKNCKNCKGLGECKNTTEGCVYYPRVIDNRLSFDDTLCKYMKEAIRFKKYKITTFEVPFALKSASFDNIDKSDKKRAEIIKWILEYYKDYKNGNIRKGLYLHGSFGSGKSYLIIALLNELAALGASVAIVHYPDLIRNLTSFPEDMEEKIRVLKTCDLLLLDDIGAENVTAWSRDSILCPIVQARMDSSLPTFFTSNLTIDELTLHLSETKDKIDKLSGARIIERIKKLSDDMELISKDRRN